MARLDGSGQVEGQAVAAATVETLIQLLTVANHRAALTGYGLGSRGTSNTEAPGTINILRQTSAGTAGVLTLNKTQDTISETLLTTGRSVFTVEPTPGSILYSNSLHPQASFDIKDAFGREFIIGGAGRMGIRASFVDVQTLDTYLLFEE